MTQEEKYYKDFFIGKLVQVLDSKSRITISYIILDLKDNGNWVDVSIYDLLDNSYSNRTQNKLFLDLLIEKKSVKLEYDNTVTYLI